MTYLLNHLPLFMVLLVAIIIIILFRLHITFNIVVTQMNTVTRVRIGATGLNKLINIGLKTMYNTDKTSDERLVNEETKLSSLFSAPSFYEGFSFLHRFKLKQLQKMSCTELSWHTQLGVNDPMGTAMLCGLLWSIKYYVIGLLSGRIRYEVKPKLEITPLYNHAHINSELKCLIKVRLSQALWISVNLVWHLSKARKKRKKLEHAARFSKEAI